MKKNFVIISCIILTSLINNAQAQKNEKPKNIGYEIKISIKNTKDTMLYLANYYGDKQYLKDSAFANKKMPGTFVFKGKEDLLGGIYIIASSGKVKLFELTIDKNQKFSIETDTIDYFKNMVINGSPENELFLSFIKDNSQKQIAANNLSNDLKAAKESKKDTSVINALELQLKEKYKEIKDYTINFIAKNPDALISKVLKVSEQIEIPEPPKKENGNIDSTWAWRYYKTHYWDNVDLTDERLLRTPVFHGKLETYFKNVVIPDNDTIKKDADELIERTSGNKEMFKYIVWWVTNYYELSKVMGQDEVFVHMVDKYYATNKCWWATESTVEAMKKRAKQLKAILINAQVPELVMPDTNNNYISNYSIKAKYTIMWFWDTDCSHCKIETPKLRDFYNKQKDSLNLEVYSIGIDTDTTRWKKYIVDNKLNWINVGKNTANIDFRKVFDVYATPVMFVLDENKKIIAKKLGVEDLPDFFVQYNRIIENRKRKGINN